jgi:hypothetical protein
LAKLALHARPVVAKLVVLQLSSNPLLDPLLAERLLLALAALGVPTEARPRMFRRAMGVIFEMILAECGRSSAADQKEASAQMHKTIASLSPTEFPNLTEFREVLAADRCAPVSSTGRVSRMKAAKIAPKASACSLGDALGAAIGGEFHPGQVRVPGPGLAVVTATAPPKGLRFDLAPRGGADQSAVVATRRRLRRQAAMAISSNPLRSTR